MLKKRKLLSLIAALSAAAIIVCSSSFLSSGSKYNDVTYRSYANLSQNSDVPALFKNDSVYASYKNYPPVISNGIEYVPLELFYGLSGIKISFSDDGSNFYIQNKKANKYISFSINDNYAVTNQNKVYEIDAPVYYGIRYVPLRIVCSETGIGCDSYNDGVNKIYAIKIYTVSGLSAKELVKIHAPELYSPSVPKNEVSDDTPEKEENVAENDSDNVNEDQNHSDGENFENNSDGSENFENTQSDKQESEKDSNPELKDEPLDTDTEETTSANTDKSTEEDDDKNNVSNVQPVKPSTQGQKPSNTQNTSKNQNTDGKGNSKNETVKDEKPAVNDPKKEEEGKTAGQEPPTEEPKINGKEEFTKPKKPSKTDNKPENTETVNDGFKDATIMLFYGPENFENARSTLYTLSGQGVKSTFFVTENDILTYPDVIREIYISGHTIGITFSESSEQLYEPGVLEERTNSTEKALYDVTKTKTRIACFPAPLEGKRAETDSRIASLGLCNVDFNGESGASYLDEDTAVRVMDEKLRDIPEWFGSDTAYIKNNHTPAGNAVVALIADSARANSNLKLALFDETTK